MRTKSISLIIAFLVSSQIFAQGDLPDVHPRISQMVGQMIMIGIGDESSLFEKDDKIIQEIKSAKVGGVIIYEKNINKNKPKDYLTSNVDLMQSVTPTPLFVSIDEEGGRVTRLKSKYGFHETVTAQYLGEIDNPDSTFYYANQTAALLKDLGINLNYAPNVDLAINPNNPVIARLGRSYGASPAKVFRNAAETIKAHRSHEVLTVLKHFPGHGSSKSDTHLGVADVSNYWQFSELMPYQSLIECELADGIMTAHIVNKHLDPNMYPATLSPFIISNILREFLNYDGVVFSDDMQMHAISSEYGFEESIKLAINAGVDVLMFANNVPGNERRTPTQIHDIIMDYIAKGEISEKRIYESYKRIMKMKEKI